MLWSLRICIYRGIQIAGILLFFIYLKFLQNELAFIVGRVASEYMNTTTTYVVLATPLDFFLWGVKHLYLRLMSQKIRNGCMAIMPETLHNVQRSFSKQD
jgi:hypothetical protein